MDLIKSEPGPMERWFIEGNPHSEADALAFAREQDAERAADQARIAELEEALRRGGVERFGKWHRFTCLGTPCSYVCEVQRAALSAGAS